MKIIDEILEKASDRIKRGKRTTNAKPISHADVQQALKELLNHPGISAEAKAKLKEVHEASTKKSQTEELKAQAEERKARGITPQQLQEKEIQRKISDKKTLDEHLETNEPEVFSTGGKAPEQVMRTKSGEKLTGGVKRRLATGEGIAVRDSKYGKTLDMQRKLKNELQQKQLSQKPDTILVSNEPEIPEEHKDHPHIKTLLDLRTHAPADKRSAIDKHINDIVTGLNSASNKSSA